MISGDSSETIFLCIEYGGRPVVGDAMAEGFRSQIRIESFRWSSGAEHRSSAQDAPTRLWHGRLQLRKRFDRSSTALYSHMKNHDRVDRARLTVLDPLVHHGQPLPRLELHMHDCFIETVSAAASDTGQVAQVTEDMAMSFETGLLRYYPRPQPGAARMAPTDYRIPVSRGGG